MPAGNGYPSLVYVGLPQGLAPFPLVATYNLASTASLPAAQLSAGTHSTTALYSSDGNYAASPSAASVVTISPSASTVTATSSANPFYVWQQVTFTVNVASASGAVPTGTVTATFLQGPMTMLPTGGSTATLDGKGNATFQLTFPLDGPNLGRFLLLR